MKKQLFILVYAMSLMACEGAFDSTVEIEVPDTEAKLVVVSYLHSTRDSLKLFVTHSQNILDFKNVQVLDDISISMTFAEQSIDLSYIGNDFFSSSPFKGEFFPGTSLELEVDHPDFETVHARTIIPSLPKFERLEYTRQATRGFGGESVDELVFDIIDPGEEDNYYSLSAFVERSDTHVHVWQEDTITHINRGNTIFFINDGLATSEGAFGNVLFSDKGFSGQKRSMKMQAYSYGVRGRDTVVQVRILSLSHDRFLYEKSLGRFYTNDGNPFVEPDNLHSNIENGFGIFSVESEVLYEVPVVN